MLPLLRCPFIDFFGSLASRGFPSVSLPSFRRAGCLWNVSGCLCVLPEGFPLILLDLVQREGWRSLWSRVRCTRARFCLLGSFMDWGYGSLRERRTPATFYVPIGSPSSSLYVRRDDGVGESSESFFLLCSRLSLPPHLCTLSEVVRRVRLPSAAPVRFPPWPPDLRLERQGGYLSLLLVEWLSLAVLLLALSLRLPCSVKRSRRCECGSSR